MTNKSSYLVTVKNVRPDAHESLVALVCEGGSVVLEGDEYVVWYEERFILRKDTGPCGYVVILTDEDHLGRVRAHPLVRRVYDESTGVPKSTYVRWDHAFFGEGLQELTRNWHAYRHTRDAPPEG